ncbi:MAG: energy-coupling factor ABC transporter ATP-binding protein, partial [Treponema sp.]|nr:energy-coupling factor ABC transporter ATP-binding protein [Treponema sp.]
MLEVTGLTVRYGDSPPALSGVSFSLRAGEKVALTGNNGAGKSTLFLTLVGILNPENGKIVFNGQELDRNNLAALRKNIGLVLQNPDDQLFMPAVYDDIAFGPRSYGRPEEETRRTIHRVMEKLGISGLDGRLSGRLSGGEKRLVSLAGVLVMEPAVLLLDEPATFLDPPSRGRLIGILADLPQAMIIATHDRGLTETLCGRELRLERGRMLPG